MLRVPISSPATNEYCGPIIPEGVGLFGCVRLKDIRAVTPSADRGTDGRDAEVLPQSFIDSKEKGLVLLDRPSDGAAKLVTAKSRQPAVAGGSFVIEEVAGIECAVSEIFKQRAMQRV